MKKIIIPLVICSIFFLVNYTQASEITGDIEAVDFQIKTDDTQVKMLNSSPLPAMYSSEDWYGILDTGVPIFSGLMADNNENTFYNFNSIGKRKIQFDGPINIKNLRLMYGVTNSSGIVHNGELELEFYNESQLVRTVKYNFGNTSDKKRISSIDIDKIVTHVEWKPIRTPMNSTVKIYELEFYVDEILTYESVSDINALSSIDTIDLNYKNPPSIYLRKNIIKLNGDIVYNDIKKTSHKFTNLKDDTSYTIEIGTVYFDGTEVWMNISVKTKSKKPDPPKDVTDFSVSFVNEEILLSFKKPPDADFLLIYKNGKLLTDKHVTNSYIDKEFEVGKKYTYRIVAVNAGGRSTGVSAVLEIPSKEVVNLRAKTTDKEVELFWDLPVYSDFELVSIYRKEDGGTLPKVKSLFSGDNYDHIFMTNGTYFKDMTVAADKSYEYKLTTLSESDVETPGKTIKTKTKQVMITGSDLLPVTPDAEKNDYKLTWEKPTTGQIKILIDGKEYKTIDAAALSYTIPSADIVMNGLGVPAIKIVPVESGTGREIGPVVIPGKTGFEVDMPFEADGVLSGGVDLLVVVGAFLLLGLAFRVVPKLFRIIRQALESKNTRIDAAGRRTSE